MKVKEEERDYDLNHVEIPKQIHKIIVNSKICCFLIFILIKSDVSFLFVHGVNKNNNVTFYLSMP